MRKVRKGGVYRYDPVPLDRLCPVSDLEPGEIVKVVHPRGCPPPNTMGHCHVSRRDGAEGNLAGLVLCGSLRKLNEKDSKE